MRQIKVQRPRFNESETTHFPSDTDITVVMNLTKGYSQSLIWTAPNASNGPASVPPTRATNDRDGCPVLPPIQ
jgi:hypothetical protein